MSWFDSFDVDPRNRHQYLQDDGRGCRRCDLIHLDYLQKHEPESIWSGMWCHCFISREEYHAITLAAKQIAAKEATT